MLNYVKSDYMHINKVSRCVVDFRLSSAIQAKGGPQDYADGMLKELVRDLATKPSYHRSDGPDCVLRGVADFPFRKGKSFFEFTHQLRKGQPFIADSAPMSTSYGEPFMPEEGANMKGCSQGGRCGLVVVHLGDDARSHGGRDISSALPGSEKEVLFLPLTPFKKVASRRVKKPAGEPPVKCGAIVIDFDQLQKRGPEYNFDWILELTAEDARGGDEAGDAGLPRRDAAGCDLCVDMNLPR